ncbi:MAG: Na+/H+ antiporter NhaC family protein, partial [Bacteroidota bacterium]
MKNHLILLILLIWSTSKLSFAQNDSTIQILPISPEVATIALNQYKLSADDKGLIFKVPESSGTSNISINGEEKTLTFVDNTARVDLDVDEKGQLHLIKADSGFKLYHLAKRRGTVRLKHIPLWLSILPPLIAIVLALIFKEVILSLFVGTWMGAFIAGGMRFDSIYYFLQSIMNVIDTYILNALNDSGHLSVIIFSLLIGGMVGIISRNGGMAGIVVRLSKYAKTAQSAQLVTWILGVAIFFDDYANTLIVGNTIRSVTDKYKVSREKLAYIVDSTAAPVAAVAFITTWIGAELGYIDDGIKLLTNFDLNVTPYAIFISSLKYSFYPLFTLCFILLLIYFQKDYGPMHKAELRARTTGEVSPPTSSKKEIEELE